jgi:galactokinase
MTLTTDFQAVYGRDPDGVWQAPGRVNLIGEHTDYNDGLVLPIALPRRIVVAAAARDDGVLRLRSGQDDAVVEVALADLSPGSVDGWAAYPAGAAWALREAGHAVGGADVLVDSDLPTGAGLSSSAALLCAMSTALLDLASIAVPPQDVARLAQRAENAYVGAPVGLMDQMASMCCTAGHALFFDVRSLSLSQVPFDPAAEGLRLLVVDVRAPHRLVDSEYAARRASCEEAAAVLGVPSLREVTDLAAALESLPDETLRKRVRHVVTEIARVSDAVELMRAGRLRDVGPLFTASHASMRDDFEITVPELDVAVDTVLAAGVLGARMTGGGFGGCIIALVEAPAADASYTAVQKAFADHGFADPALILATPSNGAGRLP